MKKMRLRGFQSFALRDSLEGAVSGFQPSLGDPGVGHAAFSPRSARPTFPPAVTPRPSGQSRHRPPGHGLQALLPALCTPLPLSTGVGTKRLLSRVGSDPRKLVPGAEPAGARTILLDTPPAGQSGAFSLSFFQVLLPWGQGASQMAQW